MERVFIFVIILWLGAFETPHAQVSPQFGPAPSATLGAGVTETPCTTSSLSVSSTSTATGCVPNPLNVPNSSAISPTRSTTGTVPGSSASGMSASPSINPQTALQLPGEAPNTTAQAPITTASQPGVSSTAICSPAIASTAGALSPGNLVGTISLGGC
jgi:hypothetical protein